MDTDPTPEDGGQHVIRSEEELRVDTTWAATERVRFRKRIVTEQVDITVSVRREELVVERESVRDSGRTGADPALGEPWVIVLHREEPVVETRVVPVERVTVSTHRVTDAQIVSESLRAERVEIERVDAERG